MRAISIIGIVAASLAGAANGMGPDPGGPGASRAPRRILPPANPTDGPGFSDNFDSYANGSMLVPQGGWLYWNGSGPPVSNNATVDNALSVSAPNSVVAIAETDMVQVFNITSGRWRSRVQTYTPSTGTGIGFYIMLNTYAYPNTTNAGNWSLELQLNNATHLVSDISRRAGFPTTTVPLINDQWVELVIDIDLDADQYSITYGGQTLTAGRQWSFNASGTMGQPRIQCIDLYSQMAGFRWDDVSLLPVTAACYPDCNGDHALNVNDFICFQSAFAANSPQADCDHNTTLNVNDFICFQSSFAAGCSQL